MKRLLLIPLALLFFSCDRNPTVSEDNSIYLNWAAEYDDVCYFTDTNNICEGLGALTNDIVIANQYESLEVISIYDTGNLWSYAVELCNSIEPAIIEFVNDSGFTDDYYCYHLAPNDDGLQNYFIDGTCYEWIYQSTYSNTCRTIDGVDYVQYK